MASNFKSPRIRNRNHLDFCRDLPCVRCLHSPCDPSHIRIYGQAGTGLKSGDNTVVPLCHAHHMQSHEGERTFWGDRLEDAISLANALYVLTGIHSACVERIMQFRKRS